MTASSAAWHRALSSLKHRTRHLSCHKRLVLLILLLMSCRLGVYAVLAGSITSLPQKFCAWDCGWYMYLASHGYDLHPETLQSPTLGQPGKADWPFFPVFPGLVHTTAIALHISPVMAGFVVSNCALCVFVFFATKYMQIATKPMNTTGLVVFLFSFPYGFYLSAQYTESSFAAIAMIAFYCLARNRILSASLAAAVLSATRVLGVAMTPIILFHYCRVVISTLRSGDRRGAWDLFLVAVLPVALAPLGLFLFMLYLYFHTGDAFAFVHIQRAWDRTREDPLTALYYGLLQFDIGTHFGSYSGTFSALCALAGIGMSIRLSLQARLAESWFLLVSILVPLTDGLESLPRFVLANPIFLVYAFNFVWASKYRLLFPELIIVFVLLQLFLVHLWFLDSVSLI